MRFSRTAPLFKKRPPGLIFADSPGRRRVRVAVAGVQGGPFQGVEVGALAPADPVGGWLHPFQLLRPPTLLRPGQPPAAATSTAGDRMAVQGVSGARWRCWPSSLESSFYSEIQGVEAVEVGGSCRRLRVGSGGSMALAPGSHPGQLARPPTLLRPGQPPAVSAAASTAAV